MNERDQARALLPPWVTWAGPVAYLVLVAVVSALAAWLAIAIGMAGYAKAAQAHWTERARRALPARALSLLCLLMLPGIAAVYAHLWVGPFTLGSSRALEICALLAALAVTTFTHFRLPRQVVPEPPSFGYWLKGALTMLLVMRPMFPIVVAMFMLAPATLGSWAAVAWAAVALLLMALAMGGATVPVGRELGRA